MANKHMKKGSTSLAMSEMQIKTSLIFHLILDRKAIIKKTANAGKDTGQRDPTHCWWECSSAGSVEISMEAPYKVKVDLLYYPTVPFLGI
jgi:hypothetical protein